MKPRKVKEFINNYETKIKYLRQDYYNKISLNQSNEELLFLEKILDIIPYIITTILLILFRFTIGSIIISIMQIILYESIKETIIKKFNIRSNNNYLKAIKKQKYKSIEEFEKNIKEIITGPNGYYTKLLNTLKEEHHINDETKTIQTVDGETMYIWSNKKQNMIFLLKDNTNIKPQLQRIKTTYINYFRKDKDTKNIVLQTTENLYVLKPESEQILNEIIPNKKYETNNIFKPEEYIKEFELYIHKQNKNIIEKIKKDTNLINNNNIYIIICIILMLITMIIKSIIPTTIFKVAILILNYIIINNYQSLIITLNQKSNQKNNALKIIKAQQETKNRFNELKNMLNIKDSYKTIFTKNGEKIIIWKNTNYIHLFFNEIKENIKYIVVKSKAIICNQINEENLVLSIKNKRIELRKDAIDTLKLYL